MDKLNDITFRIIEKFFYLLGSRPREQAHHLSDLLGRLWFRFDIRHRRVALDNLNRAFGQEMGPGEIEGIARRVFKNLILVLFETGWCLHLRPEDFDRYFKIKNRLSGNENDLKSKGVLILTGHVGNWELTPIISAMTEHTAHVLYRPMDYAPLERFFAQNRTRFGAKLISKDASLLRVFKALKRRESVVMLLDQNVGWHKGVFVDFFGRRACTSYGLAFIAMKTGAAPRATAGQYTAYNPSYMAWRKNKTGARNAAAGHRTCHMTLPRISVTGKSSGPAERLQVGLRYRHGMLIRRHGIACRRC